MRALLRLSRSIDRMNERIGSALSWIVLLAVFVSAGTATARKAFDASSNGLLEIQWYLFAAMFLLAAGYTLLRQEHVRIDVLLGSFARRSQVKIEIFGIVVFLFPFVAVMVDLVLPLVIRAYLTGEMSSNEGGLIRWPVYALVPTGFVLLGLQGISELIKRIAFLRGLAEDPASHRGRKSAEEDLISALRNQQDEASR